MVILIPCTGIHWVIFRMKWPVSFSHEGVFLFFGGGAICRSNPLTVYCLWCVQGPPQISPLWPAGGGKQPWEKNLSFSGDWSWPGISQSARAHTRTHTHCRAENNHAVVKEEEEEEAWADRGLKLLGYIGPLPINAAIVTCLTCDVVCFGSQAFCLLCHSFFFSLFSFSEYIRFSLLGS